MKNLYSIILLIAVVLASSRAAVSLEDTGRLNLTADYAAFRIQNDTANAFVEIHYNLQRSQLQYLPDPNGYVAYIDFKIALKNQDGALLDTVSWRAGNRIEKLSLLDDPGFFITDMISEIIPAGGYDVEIVATNEGNEGRIAFPMEIPAFYESQPELSSIVLAYEISPDTAGKFVKNGYRVMPNPSGQFNRADRKIGFYAEAYGLETSPSADSSFYITLDLLSHEGIITGAATTIMYHKPGESAVIIAEMPIDSLEAGEYNLKVTLSDGNSSISTTRDFSVIVSRKAARETFLQGVLKDFPEGLNIVGENDAEKFRDEIVFIATRDELKLYDSLNLPGKGAFQKDFWARRDPEPSTAVNEFMVEHYRRFKYVNSAFGRFRGEMAGWKSDRGRIYLMYGDPSEIERFPSTLEARAWERWWYHGIEGGVFFIFVDYETADDFTLVHSTKKSEVKDYDWEEKIRVTTFRR